MVKSRGGAALFVIAALSGCAAGGALTGPQAPRSVEYPDHVLTSAAGSPLAASVWEAENARAVILALHGFGDHAVSTFRKAGSYWRANGITTVAYDQRGFGRNPSRGFWPGARALADDAKNAVRQVREMYPCKPVVLLGHSMGGGVALAAAREVAIDGLVLAAPAIWGGAELNPFHRLLAWAAASVVPERRFTGRGVVRIQASDNVEILRELGRDPLYLSPPSAREIFGLVRVTDLAEAAVPEVTAPALLLLGGKDQILPSERVRRVFGRLQGPRREVFYEDGWHLLFRDLQAERVWRDVAGWIEAQVPAPQCAPGQEARSELPSSVLPKPAGRDMPFADASALAKAAGGDPEP